MIVGPIRRGERPGIGGVDDADTSASVPRDWRGVVVTDRIELIGPLRRGAACAMSHPLHVSRLTLTTSANHAALDLQLDARPVCLFGPNGAGKTNILEALTMLAPGRVCAAPR